MARTCWRIAVATSSRLRSISGRSKSRWRTPRAVLAIAGWRRWVASITRSRASRSRSSALVGAAGDSALEDRRDDGELIVDPLLGDEDPHQRVLQVRSHGEARRSRSGRRLVRVRSTNHVGMPSRSASSDRRYWLKCSRGARWSSSSSSGRRSGASAVRSAKTCRIAASPSVESSPPSTLAADLGGGHRRRRSRGGTPAPSRPADRRQAAGRPARANSSNVIGGADVVGRQASSRRGSMRSSGAPPSTCTLRATNTSRHGAADRRRDGDLHLHRLDDGDPIARRRRRRRDRRRRRRRGRSPAPAGCRRRHGRSGGRRRRPRRDGWRRRSPRPRRTGDRRWSAGCVPGREVGASTTSD